MEIGLVGLPQSGKTTVYQALTRAAQHGHALEGGRKNQPHISVVGISLSRPVSFMFSE